MIAPLRPTSVATRPTRAGATILVVTALSFAAAWLGFGVPFAVVAMLGGALSAVAAFASRRHASALRVAAPPPTTAIAAERFVLDVPIANLAKRAAAFDVLVSVGGPTAGDLRVGAFVARLAAGAETRIDVSHPVLRRGVHPQGLLDLESSFPLGLWTCRLRFALPNEALVLPWMGRLWRLPKPAARVRGGTGHGGVSLGDEQEVYGIRAWREGESLRPVHWKLSARRGRLLVREFRSEPLPPVHVVLVARIDVDSRKTRSAFENAVALAATLVEQKTLAGHAVHLSIVGAARRTIACRRGRGAVFAALRALATVDPEIGADAADGAARVRGRPGEMTYVVRVAPTSDARVDAGVVALDVDDRGLPPVFDRRRRPGRELLAGVRR